jgi:hypothetical protein
MTGVLQSALNFIGYHINPQRLRTKPHNRSLRNSALQTAHDLLHMSPFPPRARGSSPLLTINTTGGFSAVGRRFQLAVVAGLVRIFP